MPLTAVNLFVTSFLNQAGISTDGQPVAGSNGVTSSSDLPASVASHETAHAASVLLQVLCHDIPVRLIQFRSSIEADSEVLQRMYLVKNECRAPFRAFLEGHMSLQRAPDLDIVIEYRRTASANTKAAEQLRAAAKKKLQKLLETPVLVEVLTLEQQIEEFEIEIAKQIYPYCELYRYLESKRARLRPVPALFDDAELGGVRQTLYRLKNILCRNSSTTGGGTGNVQNTSSSCGSGTSSGIRPLLLDLQGIPRDDDVDFGMPTRIAAKPPGATKSESLLVESRLDQLLKHMEIIKNLCQTRNAFRMEKKTNSNNAGDYVDNIPATIVRGCVDDFD
jgi:hypothetical protein